MLYLFFGAATTLVNFILYTIFVELFDYGITVSNGIAWCGAVIFAFFTNKYYVFGDRNFGWKALFFQAASFFGSRFLTGLIEIFLPTVPYRCGLDFDLFGIKGFTAKLVVSVLVVVLNYIFSKVIVFRKRTMQDE